MPDRPAWLPGPVVLAPMAGGPSTPELVSAVSSAGALGFLPAGNTTPDGLAGQIATVRDAGVAHFVVNLFALERDPSDVAAMSTYADRLAPHAARLGVGLGVIDPGDDDHRAAKVALVAELAVPVVSFTFGLPSPGEVALLRAAGSVLLATVTSPEEAVAAGALGVDGLIVQGPESGGHRGGCTRRRPNPTPAPSHARHHTSARRPAGPDLSAGGRRRRSPRSEWTHLWAGTGWRAGTDLPGKVDPLPFPPTVQ